MIRFFLILLSMFILGCGNAGIDLIPSAPSKAIVGPLKTRAVITSYSDSINPYNATQINELMVDLNQTIVRNSNGRAWLEFDVTYINIPGNVISYSDINYQMSPFLDSKVPYTKLQNDCFAAIERKKYTMYFTPPNPVIFVGYRNIDSFAWLSATQEPKYMPVPHEFGHMLGFVHKVYGIMHGTDAWAQNNYNGVYDDESLMSIDWLLKI